MRKQKLGERVHCEACLSLEWPLCTQKGLGGMAGGGKWKVCGCWMSQQLIKRAWGSFEVRGGREKSQGLKTIHISREMEGNLHLDTSCYSCASRLNEQPLLLSQCSSRAGGH